MDFPVNRTVVIMSKLEFRRKKSSAVGRQAMIVSMLPAIGHRVARRC